MSKESVLDELFARMTSNEEMQFPELTEEEIKLLAKCQNVKFDKRMYGQWAIFKSRVSDFNRVFHKYNQISQELSDICEAFVSTNLLAKLRLSLKDRGCWNEQIASAIEDTFLLSNTGFSSRYCYSLAEFIELCKGKFLEPWKDEADRLLADILEKIKALDEEEEE